MGDFGPKYDEKTTPILINEEEQRDNLERNWTLSL